MITTIPVQIFLSLAWVQVFMHVLWPGVLWSSVHVTIYCRNSTIYKWLVIVTISCGPVSQAGNDWWNLVVLACSSMERTFEGTHEFGYHFICAARWRASCNQSAHYNETRLPVIRSPPPDRYVNGQGYPWPLYNYIKYPGPLATSHSITFCVFPEISVVCRSIEHWASFSQC